MADPLWAELINSDWHDYRGSGAREDRIGNDRWLVGFLGRAGWDRKALPSVEGREQLRSLRELMRRVVDAFRATGGVPDLELEELNRRLAGAPRVRRLEPVDRLALEVTTIPAVGGMARVLGEVVASFAAMLAQGEPERLKYCDNPDCRWVMYDLSRNRSRRWCDAADCGNLIKVRRHRQRKRGAPANGDM